MFVYLTYCEVNRKKYIGKYEGSEEVNYLGSGKLLKRAIEKHGPQAFTRVILEKYNTKEECSLGEKKWIELFDAVNRKDFYNIASGGDGGNTYKGIEGEERLQLTAKLKSRRKRKSPKGMVAYIDLISGNSSSCTVEEFKNQPYFIGAKTKFLYNTPLGIFSSLKVANRVLGLDMSSLGKRCRENYRTITKRHLSGSNHKLLEHDTQYIGRTFEQAGYSCLPVSLFLSYTLLAKYKLKLIK